MRSCTTPCIIRYCYLQCLHAASLHILGHLTCWTGIEIVGAVPGDPSRTSPNNSEQIVFDCIESNSQGTPAETIITNMATFTRYDGRTAYETRSITISLGELARADGSARFSYGKFSVQVIARFESFSILHDIRKGIGKHPAALVVADTAMTGSTSCLASFTGPIEVRIREEMPDKATLEVTHRPLEGVGGEYCASYRVPRICAHVYLAVGKFKA